jgi:hypothetical protein
MNRGYRAQAEKNHLARLAKARREQEPRKHGKGEAEVVPGYELSMVLRRWVVQRMLLEQSTHEWLAERTGIHVRRISGLINGEYTLVPLSQADLVLRAIERADLYRTDIHVIPNPNWTQERWHEYMTERGCGDE